MKFHLAVNLERMNDATDMMAVQKHTLEMVQMADRAGFEIAWAAEHHALEMTIAPNPFQLLTWWADRTDSIRLGSGVANAAYWHPINIAGEAAMVDLAVLPAPVQTTGSPLANRSADLVDVMCGELRSGRLLDLFPPEASLAGNATCSEASLTSIKAVASLSTLGADASNVGASGDAIFG